LPPKLFVRKEDAIPVSLLSLRSSVITPDTMALDRQLGDMLARSVSAQPKVFVLERQRLERLAYEKEWQADTEAFWNGAMVIGSGASENVLWTVTEVKIDLGWPFTLPVILCGAVGLLCLVWPSPKPPKLP